MKGRKYLLTGATGLIGSYLLNILLQNGHIVYIVSRGNNGEHSRERVIKLLNFWQVQRKELLNNLKVLNGDITQKGLGLSCSDLLTLKNNVEELFHLAATTKLNCSLIDARKVNVNGTRNVLELAKKMKTAGRLSKVNHFSTAYVCGDYSNLFRETDLDVGQNFGTSYEQSKFEAEHLVGQYRNKGLGIDIFRPPIVTGHSKTGRIFQFRNIYQIADLARIKLFESLPIKNFRVNLVPVDELCNAVYRISRETVEVNRNYHPFSNKSVLLSDIIKCYCEMNRIKVPRVVTNEEFMSSKLTEVQKKILRGITQSINYVASIDSHITLNELKKYGYTMPKPDWPYLKTLMKYYIGITRCQIKGLYEK